MHYHKAHQNDWERIALCMDFEFSPGECKLQVMKLTATTANANMQTTNIPTTTANATVSFASNHCNIVPVSKVNDLRQYSDVTDIYRFSFTFTDQSNS